MLSWQATSGDGTTTGGQTTFAGYSGAGQYFADYGNVTGSGGSIQGSFSQGQSNTTSWNFNTDDSLQPPPPRGQGRLLAGHGRRAARRSIPAAAASPTRARAPTAARAAPAAR